MQIMTDSPIRFPGLFGDWAFTASSKALDIGNGIYWYGILIALGLVIAIWWCMNQKSKYGITEDDLLDSVLWGIPCAIVGARIYYVLFYLDQFKNSDGSFSFRKAIAIWDGGLAIYGAVIAVVIVGICVSRHRGYKLGAMLDLAVMGLLIGQCIGRWGNFMNREAFGAETTLPWRGSIPRSCMRACGIWWACCSLSSWYPRPAASTAKTPGSTSCGTASAASGSRACGPTACTSSTGPSAASPSGCLRP